MIEQLSLLSHGLSPLTLNRRVRVIAEEREGVIAQLWPGRDWYAVYAFGHGSLWEPIPTYRRDELEALPILDDEAERAAVARICRPLE